MIADRRSFAGCSTPPTAGVGKQTVTELAEKAKVRGSSSYQVKLSLKDAHPRAYNEAVDLVVRLARPMRVAGCEADFAPYLVKLRNAHKPKRNLLKLFDERSW